MLLGADIGGTFTDFVFWTGTELRTYKLPTTTAQPDNALLAGMTHLGADRPDVTLVHGSTVATNAFLERKGGRVVLVTTVGFADVLEIGRQTRIGIYDPRTVKPAPLVPAERRVEAAGRLDTSGQILMPLSDDEVARVVAMVATLQPEAIAICLLHSYANPAHERRLATALSAICPFVYASADVDPVYREYERSSTTVLHAYVAPLVARYVERLRSRVPGALRLMGSDGGVQTGSELSRPADMILSGPAGGVVGAFAVAEAAGEDHVITLDMGGTSADVALLPGKILTTRETLLDGLPLRSPMLDIHAVGAGGGSIARFDLGGALVVGPESAGADPGPACYGRGGTAFTVTDAHLLLGHLVPDHFLGGRMRLDVPAAEAAAQATMSGHMADPRELAQGVLSVANATMERAIRTVSARRGYDPADFTLFCFGGAGGLHAISLARSLGMRGVMMPRLAGTLSALGMVLARQQSTHRTSVLQLLTELEERQLMRDYKALATRCIADFNTGMRDADQQPASPHAIRTSRDLDPTADGLPVRYEFEWQLDMRYRGQSYELPIKMHGSLQAATEAFHEEHARRFGYADREAAVEVVSMSVTMRDSASEVVLPELDPGEPSLPYTTVEAWFDERSCTTPVYALEALARDQRIGGPAILAGEYATLLLPPDSSASVDRFGNVQVPLEGRDERNRK